MNMTKITKGKNLKKFLAKNRKTKNQLQKIQNKNPIYSQKYFELNTA
jgi:hypothetical protein